MNFGKLIIWSVLAVIVIAAIAGNILTFLVKDAKKKYDWDAGDRVLILLFDIFLCVLLLWYFFGHIKITI